MTNRTDLIYGSPEYLAEVSRIHEQEAYGVKTAAAWNRLNDRTAPHPWAFLWDLIGHFGVAAIWVISLIPFGFIVIGLLRTFHLI